MSNDSLSFHLIQNVKHELIVCEAIEEDNSAKKVIFSLDDLR